MTKLKTLAEAEAEREALEKTKPESKPAIVRDLEARGGKLWEAYGKRRMYFDPATLLGLRVTRYGTGNISSATRHGEKISNAAAREMIDAKAYIDLATMQCVVRGTWGDELRDALETILREVSR